MTPAGKSNESSIPYQGGQGRERCCRDCFEEQGEDQGGGARGLAGEPGPGAGADQPGAAAEAALLPLPAQDVRGRVRKAGEVVPALPADHADPSGMLFSDVVSSINDVKFRHNVLFTFIRDFVAG